MPLWIEKTVSSKDGIPSSISIDSWLAQYPELKERSNLFHDKPILILDSSDKIVYIGQGEYGTVSRSGNDIKFIGSDDATTCHILVIHDQSGSAISVAHLDGAECTKAIQSMFAEIKGIWSNCNCHSPQSTPSFYAHVIGGFVDNKGHSNKIFRSIINVLSSSDEDIILEMASVYNLNTTYCNGAARPMLYGVAMDCAAMVLHPARFLYKGPEEIMRHARNFSSGPQVTRVYDHVRNLFIIEPFHCKPFTGAETVQYLRDGDILHYFSTSPHCEPSHFVENFKRTVDFLIRNEGRYLFPNNAPRFYKVRNDGQWILI